MSGRWLQKSATCNLAVELRFAKQTNPTHILCIVALRPDKPQTLHNANACMTNECATCTLSIGCVKTQMIFIPLPASGSLEVNQDLKKAHFASTS